MPEERRALGRIGTNMEKLFGLILKNLCDRRRSGSTLLDTIMDLGFDKFGDILIV
jgi:hypothetical protein